VKRVPLPRIGPGALIILGHVLLAFALLQHGGIAPRGPDPAPAEYIELAFIAAPTMRAPAIAPPPLVAPRLPVRRAAATPGIEPAPVAVPIPAAMDTASTEEPIATAQEGRMDMESLRAAARQVDSERTPGALELLRASDDSGLARAVRKAKRLDCQTKYSGGTSFDVLLLIPLAIETITDKGCKW